MKPLHLVLATCLVASLGCKVPILHRPTKPVESTAETGVDVRYVGDISQPYGMNYIKVEAVSLVTGLAGTGSDPPPSPQRAALLSEMQHREVVHPERILASEDTALVLVRGFLPPGVQKGDKFDVEVRVPTRSEAESLRGGYLLESRMTELAVLGNQIREGHLLALSKGPVLVDPAAAASDRLGLTQGRVLGGGVALKSRTLGLALHDEHQQVRISQQIGAAINRRFHTYVRGVKQGVATPKTDKYVELIVHDRYRDNIGRYMRVVANIALRESPSEFQQRMQLLEKQLLDPVSTRTAAVRLEAIGKKGVPILKQGIEHADPEVRFRSAEALAYLGSPDAAKPLAEAARNEPAFRLLAFAALSAMDDIVSRDELRKLLNEKSVETRYGAFRALWKQNPNEPAIGGETLGGAFGFHVVDSEGGPLVHVTRSTRAEVALFGRNLRIGTPFLLEAGPILVRGEGEDEVVVSRFAVGEADQKRTVSNDVEEIVRAIVDVGGTYPDVVQALQQADAAGVLPARFAVEAIPRTGREYERESEASTAEQTDSNWSRFLSPWKDE